MRRLGNQTRPGFVSADEAVELVKDGDVISIEGSGGGVLEPDALIDALARRFRRAGKPRGITIIHCSGIGDRAGSGVAKLADPVLLRRVICGHYGMSMAIADLVAENAIEAYNFPQGVLAQLHREIAGGRPGLITHVGLGMYCDPRISGGKLNERTTEDLVSLIELDGREWLWYKKIPIDIAFIRGTTADEQGNLSLEYEPAKLGVLNVAMAARNSGGVVIAQVKRVAQRGTLKAKDVVVPGHLVDLVVVSEGQRQTATDDYNPSFSGEVRVPVDAFEPLELGERKVIARRAFLELERGFVVNLGVGMADGVATVAAEEGALDDITLTIEQGVTGGSPARGVIFGVAWNPSAIIDQPSQFDFYDGGGLDAACLGFAEIDRRGNVNASKIGPRIVGVGGFVNISQNARKLIFCGTFTSGGLVTKVGDGRISIVKEGSYRKFVDRVCHLTFNAARALECGQRVMYVTERAVFELRPDGLELVELAPGIDLERDVLAQMDFRPIIRSPLGEMSPRLFSEARLRDSEEGQ